MFQIENKTHTSDIRLLIKADGIEELFKAGMIGLSKEIVGDFFPESPQKEYSKTIKISSIDRTTLLIDFLSELLALSQIHQVIFFDVEFIRFEDCDLEAEVLGMYLDGIAEEIKAVTYHEAEVVFDDGLWSTYLVFDI